MANMIGTILSLLSIPLFVKAATIDCSDSHECTVNCTADYACYQDDIYCAADCTVLCSGRSACYEATISIPSNASASISCSGGRTEYGYGDYTCRNAIITAGSNSVVNIDCIDTEPDHDGVQGASTCASATITGESGSTVDVTCDGDRVCDSMIIDAQDASSLSVNDCSADWSCIEITVYCPQNVDGVKQCTIEGSTAGLRGWLSTPYVDAPLTFYAVNSWDEIEFNTPSKNDYYYGTMHCGPSYESSCSIDDTNNEWQCKSSSNACYVTSHPTTSAPSAVPTMTPSALTLSPSKSPSPAPSGIYGFVFFLFFSLHFHSHFIVFCLCYIDIECIQCLQRRVPH